MTKLCGLFVLATSLVMGQETRREVTNPAPNPADDQKDTTDNVPNVYALSGRFERVVILRFKYKAKLLEGFQKMVAEQKIKNAVILSAMGSVRGYHIHQVSNSSFPSKDMFEKNPNAPADLISMNGYVIDGRIHAHMTLATPEKAFGGHLEAGTEVFTFAVVALGVLNNDIDLSKVDDKSYR